MWTRLRCILTLADPVMPGVMVGVLTAIIGGVLLLPGGLFVYPVYSAMEQLMGENAWGLLIFLVGVGRAGAPLFASRVGRQRAAFVSLVLWLFLTITLWSGKGPVVPLMLISPGNVAAECWITYRLRGAGDEDLWAHLRWR